MPPKFSLVISTYNERSNIAELYRRIAAVLDSQPFDSEIIFVDDNSQDFTWQTAQDLVNRIKGGSMADWKQCLTFSVILPN